MDDDNFMRLYKGMNFAADLAKSMEPPVSTFGKEPNLAAEIEKSLASSAEKFLKNNMAADLSRLLESNTSAMRAADIIADQHWNEVVNAKNYFDQYNSTNYIKESIRQEQLMAHSGPLSLTDWLAREDLSLYVAQASNELSKSYDLARKFGVDRLAEDLNRSQRWLQDIQLAQSAALSMLTSELLGSVANGVLSPALAEGFGAELLGQLAKAEEADSEAEIVSFLKEFLAWLIKQANRLPNTKLSGEVVFSIFLTVVSLLYAQHSNWQTNQDIKSVKREVSDSERRVIRELHETEAQLVTELKKSAQKISGGEVHVIIKAAQLRQGPSTEFVSIRVLPPNLFVNEIEQKDGWSHIEYFDYVDAKTKQGWVSSELLIKKSE